MRDFYMIVSADPQWPWRCGKGTICEQLADTVEVQAALSNTWQTDSMNKVIEQFGSQVQGIIVNGDLTAFGHDTELKQYREYFYDRLLAPVYEGLGNHDYANNIDDCFSNNCARRMVKYLDSQIRASGSHIVNYDFKKGDVYYQFPYFRKDYQGSLSYSFDVQGVHFIQLNNFPGYERSFDAWNYKMARRDQFHITSGFAWLEHDLKEAQSKDQRIVLNMHDFVNHISTEQFNHLKKLVVKYDVEAIFWGHYHRLVGRGMRDYPVPVYHSGSSPFNSYLLVHFHDHRIQEVQVIRSDYGQVSVENQL